jgi:hypothetical protein
MDLRDIRFANINWIDLLHNRDWWQAPVNMVKNLQITQKVGKFLH